MVQCEGSGLVSTISIKAGADVKGSLDSWVPVRAAPPGDGQAVLQQQPVCPLHA